MGLVPAPPGNRYLDYEGKIAVSGLCTALKFLLYYGWQQEVPVSKLPLAWKAAKNRMFVLYRGKIDSFRIIILNKAPLMAYPTIN